MLISPEHGATIVGEKVTEFSWQWDGHLQEEERFELQIWRPGKPHFTVALPRTSSYLLDTPPDGFGEYLWRVLVVRVEESGGSLMQSESLERLFIWSTPTLTPTPSPVNVDTPTPAPTPMLTPTFTPTPTATDWPTDTPTPTPTGTSTPTPTPTPTETGTPTLTCSPTLTPVPTATPSPTLSLLPAPILLEPEKDAAYCSDRQIALKWEWNARPFNANEFYAVRIWKDEPEATEHSRHWEPDYQKIIYLTEKPKDGPSWFQGEDAYYFWNVVVLFDTGQVDELGFKVWQPVSETSESRRFFVRRWNDPVCMP